MRLFHGTSDRHLDAIIKDGLKPRGKSKGNWKHTILSNPKAVYLTEAYALHYALCATDPGNGDRLAILEIDADTINEPLLAPDEDFLEQATRLQQGSHLAPIDKPMKYRTRWYRKRLAGFQSYWRDSLSGLGNCTYHGTIPPRAIKRVAMLDQKTNADLIWMAGLDPQISLMNYRIVGAKYRNSIKRLFKEQVEEDDPFASVFTDERQAERKAMLNEIWNRVEVMAL